MAKNTLLSTSQTHTWPITSGINSIFVLMILGQLNAQMWKTAYAGYTGYVTGDVIVTYGGRVHYYYLVILNNIFIV